MCDSLRDRVTLFFSEFCSISAPLFCHFGRRLLDEKAIGRCKVWRNLGAGWHTCFDESGNEAASHIAGAENDELARQCGRILAAEVVERFGKLAANICKSFVLYRGPMRIEQQKNTPQF